MRVFAVVLNYNSTDLTRECLDSLVKIQIPNSKFQIILIDNGSRKEEAEKLAGSVLPGTGKPRIKFIASKRNLGFAGGNNLGIKCALENKADYVLILNNDTEVDKDFAQELIRVIKLDKSIGAAAPKIYFAPGFEFHKKRYQKSELGKVIWGVGGIMDWDNVLGRHRGVDEVDRGQYDRIEEIDYASGCCFLIKREVLEKVGLFNESYFLYYEDVDLSERLKKAGYKTMYVPKAAIWHKNAGSGGGSGSDLQDYYITRNRLLFGLKYAPARSKLALIKESGRLLVKGRKWQKAGVKDFYLRRFGQGSYG